MLLRSSVDNNERVSTCEHRGECHFFGIKEMNEHSLRMRELYCLEWPERCAIHQAKTLGKPVSITLWPGGKLQTM